jgi:cyclophilin family peptidyl-prolyl cis-trans isomerase
MLNRPNQSLPAIISLALLVALLRPPSCAAGEKLDSELLPPDVTLQNPGSSQRSQSTPGTPGADSAQTPGTQRIGTTPATFPQTPVTPSSGPPVVAADAQKPDPMATIETDKGTIVIRLFRKLAPRTVASFIDIVNSGFYNGLSFHRVEPGFCIQGGDPRGDGSGVYFEPGGQQIRLLTLEANPLLKHNAAGVVAMAHFPRNPDTSSCQFYITLAPQPSLDGQYSIFGGVVGGMDVVKAIVKGDKIKQITIQDE